MSIFEFKDEPGIIVSIGAPGSGKSTFFDNLHAPEHLRLERDRFRECMFGSRSAFWANPTPTAQKSKVVARAMLTALSYWPHAKYILSDTGVAEEACGTFISRARGVYRSRTNNLLPVHLVVFEQPWDVIEERNALRPEDHRLEVNRLRDMFDLVYAEDAWWRVFPDTSASKKITLSRAPEAAIEIVRQVFGVYEAGIKEGRRQKTNEIKAVLSHD